jgi:hypothetical protein
MKSEHKLEAWALQEGPRVLEGAIVQLDRYSIMAFGRYRITRAHGRYSVDTGTHQANFGSSRTAMTYCVLDRAGRPDWCIHMRQLDERRTRLSEDIDARDQLMRRSKNVRMHDVVTDKLASKRATLATVEHQLDKYVDRAKYLQHQGFTNETARTRRT